MSQNRRILLSLAIRYRAEYWNALRSGDFATLNPAMSDLIHVQESLVTLRQTGRLVF